MFTLSKTTSIKNFELVDVTMRDGALGRKFPYSLAQLKTYLHLLEALGIKYAEIGFIGGPGRWAEGKVDSPNYNITPKINDLLHTDSSLKLWSMIDSDNSRLKKDQVHTNKESLVRLTADFDKTHLLKEKIGICKQKNIPFSVNLKHTGSYNLAQIQSMAEFAQDQGAKIFYIVDTSGTMIPTQVAQITSHLQKNLSIDLGFHGHNNLGFAGANSLTAIEHGCMFIDASLCGIGAGGGNAITETLLLLTKGEQCDWNKLLDARKLLNFSSEYQELQERIFWGFIGCNTATKQKLIKNNPESMLAKKAIEWKYGSVLSKGEYTTLRLLNRPTPMIIKTATRDGAAKLVKEINFLELNKARLHHDFLPSISSYETGDQYAYYSTPYLHGPLLRDMIYSKAEFSLCSQNITKVIANLNTLHLKKGTINSREFSKKFYLERLQKRWEKLQNTKSSRKTSKTSYCTSSVSSAEAESLFYLMAKGTSLSIDGKDVHFSLEHLISSLAKFDNVLEIPQSSIRLIHGDPHAGNIILHEKNAILLDPNGFLEGGDIAYDFGKLLASFDWHDLSILGMLEPIKIEVAPKVIKITNNKVYKDGHTEKRHNALRQKIMTLLDEKVVSLYANSDPLLTQRIKLLLYIHQFSFAPTLIKERPETALHILFNAVSDYTTLAKNA